MNRRQRFEIARGRFVEALTDVFTALDEAIPPDRRLASGVDGRSWEEPMKTVAGSIDNLLARFDQMQRALGLPPGHRERHAEFLAGRRD